MLDVIWMSVAWIDSVWMDVHKSSVHTDNIPRSTMTRCWYEGRRNVFYAHSINPSVCSFKTRKHEASKLPSNPGIFPLELPHSRLCGSPQSSPHRLSLTLTRIRESEGLLDPLNHLPTISIIWPDSNLPSVLRFRFYSCASPSSRTEDIRLRSRVFEHNDPVSTIPRAQVKYGTVVYAKQGIIRHGSNE